MEPIRRIRESRAVAHALDWRLKELCIQLVDETEREPEEDPARPCAPS